MLRERRGVAVFVCSQNGGVAVMKLLLLIERKLQRHQLPAPTTRPSLATSIWLSELAAKGSMALPTWLSFVFLPEAHVLSRSDCHAE